MTYGSKSDYATQYITVDLRYFSTKTFRHQIVVPYQRRSVERTLRTLWHCVCVCSIVHDLAGGSTPGTDSRNLGFHLFEVGERVTTITDIG